MITILRKQKPDNAGDLSKDLMTAIYQCLKNGKALNKTNLKVWFDKATAKLEK